VLLLVGAAGGLYWMTRGNYPVAATVSDDPTLPRIELNGYLFHAETFGDPDRPVVIVLHGGPGGDYRSLLGLQALADEYFVLFYDQRGAGLSARVPAEEIPYTSVYSDLDAFVERYGQGDPVYLIGHSWGGMLASGYLGYAPEKVAKAVLAEPGYLNVQEAQAWQAFSDKLMSGSAYGWVALRAGFAAQHVVGPDPYAAEDYLVGDGVIPFFVNHPDNPYHCPGELYSAPAWRWGTTAANAIQRGATDADLDALSAHAGETTQPVLFLAGECNSWIGPELQAKHAALYPNGQLHVIPAAGHNMFWDNPAATLDAVRAFLAQ
jgi:proline iminopeptidase